jgi:hypothetical protein
VLQGTELLDEGTHQSVLEGHRLSEMRIFFQGSVRRRQKSNNFHIVKIVQSRFRGGPVSGRAFRKVHGGDCYQLQPRPSLPSNSIELRVEVDSGAASDPIRSAHFSTTFKSIKARISKVDCLTALDCKFLRPASEDAWLSQRERKK